MVVFLDLEDDVEPPERFAGEHWLMQSAGMIRNLPSRGINDGNGDGEGRENPNREKAVTKALGCYPYVYYSACVFEYILGTNIIFKQDHNINSLPY